MYSNRRTEGMFVRGIFFLILVAAWLIAIKLVFESELCVRQLMPSFVSEL